MPERMSLSHNKLINQAQIIAGRSYLIRFSGLFQQAAPISYDSFPSFNADNGFILNKSILDIPHYMQEKS